MLPSTEQVHAHGSRGLDHDAWVPLKIIYPEADIPVLQLSMPTHEPSRLLALGERLRGLRDEGVLVSARATSPTPLPFIDWPNTTAVPAWSPECDAWAPDALERGDSAELARFRTRAPGLPYAHPTVEHFNSPVHHPGSGIRPGGTRDHDRRRIRPRTLPAVVRGCVVVSCCGGGDRPAAR